MKSIQEIFDNSLFRIPDYQRGYAWKEDQIDDFWQDLKNLQDGKQHFTGTLTFELATQEQWESWPGDQWIIAGMNYKPYYVVDGQQRITTAIILLNALIDLMGDEEQMLYQTKSDLMQKYVFRQNDRQNLKSYIFGYEKDNPSYEFLKTRIFKQSSVGAYAVHETSYTSNLAKADRVFRTHLEGLPLPHREKIFKKVTQQVKFDLKVIENDLDIFVVFETMNNRGKPLTNLEKLKNRLIYLSTLIGDAGKDEKSHLRSEINDVWKTCYEYLGKNKTNVLDDDLFLRNHFIIYHNFNKEKDFPYKDIFKDIYTINRAVNGTLEYTHISKYIQSIQLAVRQWHVINNPSDAFTSNLIGESEAFWLSRLNRLGMRFFGPLVLAVYMREQDDPKRIEFLKMLEAFIFLNFNCAGRKSNLGNPHYLNVANAYYKKSEYNGIRWGINEIIEELQYWTYGNDQEEGYFNSKEFISTVKDLFREKSEGYYSWKPLKYLLFEYEHYLQKSEGTKVSWASSTIEHILPQEFDLNGWNRKLGGFSHKQKRVLIGSLGNFVLISGVKNTELSCKDFDFKKKHPKGDGSFSGYFNGSHSEIEVAQYADWAAAQIIDRGKKMLEFFMKRWDVEFTEQEKMQLLISDENLIGKFKEISSY